jgi:dTDP-4-amino-4,6-dideoxygalactose transaminase
LLTYLFGYIPNIKKITEICNKYGTRIIEDISHNIGGQFDGKKLGTFGFAGVYSASMLKYVDGYNGAFLITNDYALNETLIEAAKRLSSPSKKRIRHSIQKTFWWNLALSRYVFSFATFPALALLKVFRPDYFERLLGPSIFFKIETTSLPNYYFEDISGFQCRTIERQLDKLDSKIESSQVIAVNANQALMKVKGFENKSFNIYEENFGAKNTYWQLVIPVKNLTQARKILFNHGVETNTTNLMNLADVCGIKLQNAQKLKDSHIFIPLHKHLLENDYIKIYMLLNKAGLI